ncbi:MAG: PHB depolymerase family esterase [Nanoarchaeota archaeon]
MKKRVVAFLTLFLMFTALFAGCRLAKDRRNGFEAGTPESPPVPVTPEDSTPQEETLPPGDYRFEIAHDDSTRYYLLHVPPSIQGEPAPLVLAFHGGMGTAEMMSQYYGWKEKSDEEGFIVAFPNGASRYATGKLATWNAGGCCGYAVDSKSDDVSFVKAVIDDIKKKASISKVFSTGMSNGGMLSYRLACDLSDTFSAIAAVSGTDNYDVCNPKSPLSIMHIHSLQDRHVLYEGGCGPDCMVGGETEFVSVPDTITRWVERNHCSKTPERVFENENGYCDLYSGCTNNVKVKVCTTKDGGHSWPGTPQAPNPLEKTTPSQAISATDEIWDFFQSS